MAVGSAQASGTAEDAAVPAATLPAGEVTIDAGAWVSSNVGPGAMLELRMFEGPLSGYALRVGGADALMPLGEGVGVIWWAVDVGRTGRAVLAAPWTTAEWLVALGAGRAVHAWSNGLCLDFFDDNVECHTPPESFEPFDDFVVSAAGEATLTFHAGSFTFGPLFELRVLVGRHAVVPLAGFGLRLGVGA